MHHEHPIPAPKANAGFTASMQHFITKALDKTYHVSLSIFSLVNFHNKLK